MPIYLAHGFRWPRDGFTGIRVHAIVHNLEDVSVEYIQNSLSRLQLAGSLRTLHPEIMQRLETSGRRIDFLEQYDPDDESDTAVTQPYAFVCDRIAMIAGGAKAERHLGDLFQTQAANASKAARERPSSTATETAVNVDPESSPNRSKSPPKPRKTRVKTLPMAIEQPFNSPPDIRALSANVHDVTNDHPIPPDAWDALAELRDQLAKDEKIGWWVVYNGDPERAFDPLSDDEAYESDIENDGTETIVSVEEGVKELRPKVAGSTTALSQPKSGTPSQQMQNRATALRSHPDAKDPHSVPPSTSSASKGTGLPSGMKPVNTAATNKQLAATVPPLRSPTGGRIPPPVPPPTPKSTARPANPPPTTTTTVSPSADLVNMNKELPLSPVSEKDMAPTATKSIPTASRSRSNTQGSMNGGTCPANTLSSSPNQTRTGYRAPHQSANTTTGTAGILTPEKEKDRDRDASATAASPKRDGGGTGGGLRRKIFGRRGTNSNSKDGTP